MREASKSKDTFIASEFDLSGGKPTLVKVHSKELHDLAAKYSSLIAESFFLQNVRGTYSDFDSYLRKAHSALLAFLKSKTLDPEDPNLLLRALYNGRVPHNSPFKPTPVVRDKKENTKGPSPSAAAGAGASQTSQQLQQQHPQLPKPPEIIHPKKYTEKLKAEASVVQRISELQKEGMWYDRRLPRNHEPSRIKAHWDYLLEEMTWLATDFASERKWKRNASKRCAKMIDKYFNDREIERLRAEKEEEIRLRRIASFIAKEIKNFWSNAQQIVEYKEQSRIEEMKKKALDQQLSYIVDQTEKYSSMLAESFVGDSSIISNATDTHDTAGGDTTCGPHSLETPSDDEFEPAQESEDDDEETIAKEEEENEEGENELYDLERNGQMSLDDLLDDLPPGYLEELTSKIDKVNETEPPASETDKPPPSPAGSDKIEIAKTLVQGEKPPSEILPTPEENEVEGTDCTKVSDEAAIAEPVIEELDASVEGVIADSASEFESEVDESESETAEEDPSTETEESDILTDAEEDEPEDEEQTVGLASLLQTFAPERAGELHEEDAALNSVAAMAESFQPKGYTLSSQTVNTKVPSLLHHTLREYQLIGLDWLVTMHEKKLNGILADEMGLGKTIQTIALLAHLACEKGNWGPHLIVVPTSVMLNWEMEFKKWCPGFKILTYYGSIKERRLKRTGWTKPNAFHICITSYKLVIQDHGSFRRKRWKYLILDEAQNIKNFKSQRWQLLLNFSTHRRLLLTGTPLQNNLMELWSLMHFLMPNVFQSHREFREWFSNPVSGMVEGNSEYNENIIRRLHKVLRPFILRRLKSEVEKQLPKKHEHVVMCRLSKRQRFLYEDFMSRSKTKETLATGNLLSVINVLMQLRKVCNHPNLFESRPVISPLLSVGITYLIPSIVWNLYENLVKDTTHPLFGMSKSDLLYTKSQSERILNLKPPGEDNYSPNTLSSPDSYFSSCGSLKRKHPDQEEDITEYDYILQTTVVSTLPDGSIKCAPKRRKFLKWCADVALPAPRTKAPIPFFLMNVDPTPYLDDINFVEAVGESAPKPFYLKVVSQPSETDRQQILNNDNHLLPAEAAFQNNVIPEVPSPTLSSPETQRGKPKSYQDDEDLSESDSLDEEEDEREDNEYEEDSFEEDSDDISESYSDDIDDEGPSRKRRKRTLAPKGDFKRLRRMSLMRKDEDKCKDSNSMEEIADSTEIDDTASEDYNLDKRNKVNCGMRKSYSGAQWAKAMGYNPSEFQETDVQARSIRNRRALIDRLKFVNDQRCEVLPVFGFDALDQCRILGSLPVMRYYGTRCRHLKIPYRGRSIKRDYINNGYFLQGYEEVYSISQVKNSQSAYIRNHPLLIWRHTKALMSAVWSLEEVLEEFSPILKRFIIYVPAVSSPLLTSRIFRPSPSLYAQQFNVEEELREVLRQPSAILHPIISSMSTQFPDPRLIQYDCGKLQILDTLLRRLKSESHRVLIFTQMAKMLDVLEAFLNYHGHIYLRLDGATRIDQRQILMEKFNSDKRIFCFILSTRSGGIGINLTGADTVIFYDSDWNPTMDAQAQDRCHRIGQTRDVHIYRLVSEKTIEENILKKSNQKRLLGELAIEGGNFTTAFFQKHSIYELFDVQTNENDVMKRLTEKSEESEKTLEIHDVEIDETDTKVGVVPETVDKNQMQIFESALAAAEDETDVQATRTVKAEAAAELAEFDESIPLEDLGDGQDIVEKSMIDTEMESIMAELSKVEIYALKFMESTIDDWSRETVAQAQKELEQQKREWEMEQIRQLEARNKMGTDYSDEEDMLTYSATDAQNQVWISQGGGEHFMPLWAPPTPPSDDSDVYVDNCHGFLYDYDLIPESNLPPVYQPPKKDKKPIVVPVPNVKQSILPAPVLTNLPDEEVVTPLNSTIEKKSPKVPRRDEPIFAPRSLFDRPSPAMAKLRRDYRLQKYNCRPVVTAALNKSTLGPGAITFPIVHPTSTKAPSPPPQHESVEWMIAEDHALLQTIQTILEMPLSLLVVNLAQTPNWDLAAEMVNLTSKIHRTPKQCKIRYETIVGPREEGKLFYEQPPAAKNKKKSKSFIKVGPPSPSRTGRIVKMSQLITADNNSQLLNTYVAKFDLVKNVAMKRPLTKPMTLNPHMKTNKQAATIFAEHGINLESPISATAIAQARYERLQLERKKLYAAQQAAVAAAGTIQSPHPVTTAALNAAAALAAEGNRISAATAVTIPLTTVGATSVIAGPIVSNAVIVPSSVGINVSPGTATVVTATASEVHKAKIAAQAAHASDLPVIRFTHPASATTLQEMIQRRSPVTPSNNPIIAKRQHVLSQQQNQLQQQLQSLQQSQMTHKQKISLQLAQVAQKPSLSTTTLQQTGGVQQIQVSSAQQVVISQPSSNLAKAQPGSNLNTSVQLQGQRQVMMQGSSQMVTQQAQSSVLSQPSIQLQQKQVVMAYQQAVSQASQQQKQQQIQIQIPQSPTVQTGTIQQATVPAQSIHVSSPQSVIINQPTSIATSITPNSPITTSIQLQGQKQIVMTGSGQAQILTQQQQQQISQSTIQLQGQKQVVMAYQTGSQGQIIQKQSPQITQQLQQSQQQQQQQTQVHVHLHTPSSQGQGVTLGHQTQTVVLPQGLAQALVSSAANLTPTLNLMTTTSPVLTTMTSSGVATSGVVTPGSISIPRTQQVGSHTAQQGRTVTMQLVKQHTVGGKTVTRTVSDSEIAAFLKQHGLTPSTRVAIAGQPGTQAQIGQLTGTKGQQVAQVQVPAAQIITSMGLQKLGYQISPGGGGTQVATVLKTPASQASSAQATSLAFPLSFSQVRNVSQKTGTHNLNKQPTQINAFQQQILSQQRRQTQQQQQQTASKLAHIAQVSSSQGSVPQLIVQATPKQIQNTINVQHIQHVLKPSQVIQGQSGVLQAQLLAHKTMSRMVTSSASAAAVSSGTVSGVSPTMVTVSSNSASGLPTAVTIPTSLVAAPSGQGGIIRISQQNQSIKPGSIQMITAQTASLLNQQQSLARPYAQGQNISTLNVTSGAVGNQSLPIRLQGSTGNVLPSPATLTNVSGAGVIVSETGNLITSVAEVTSPATKIILTEEAVKSSSSDTNANPTDNAV